MTIPEIVAARNIREVLHFTTNQGLTGILATRMVRPRDRLPTDKHIEHIYKANCPDRSRDREWHGYVNLSIGRINARLFKISARNWHRTLEADGFWAVLSFDPTILDHDGVVFATTNNAYPGVLRQAGAEGLQALFGPQVALGWGKTMTRSPREESFHTTCPQAEVLYPGDLSVEHLRRIYVREPEHQDAVGAMFSALNCSVVETRIDRRVFLAA